MFTLPHVSHVACQVSRFTFHVSHVNIIFPGQNGGASKWSVCYEQGVHRLVFTVPGSRAQPFIRVGTVSAGRAGKILIYAVLGTLYTDLCPLLSD